MGRDFENRKQAIFARSARLGKAFTRCAREIAIAVKAGGPNPEGNPSLRRAIQNARAANMPKDKIENAIKKASGVDASNFDQIMYEGYGPHGVPMIVEAATDNPTRTIANVRSIFSKHGGNMAGNVAFMFKHVCSFKLGRDGLDWESLQLELIDHGAEDMEDGKDDNGNNVYVVRGDFANFGQLQNAFEAKKITPVSSGGEWLPLNPIKLSDEQVKDVLELAEALEGDDDVQNVFHALA